MGLGIRLNGLTRAIFTDFFEADKLNERYLGKIANRGGQMEDI